MNEPALSLLFVLLMAGALSTAPAQAPPPSDPQGNATSAPAPPEAAAGQAVPSGQPAAQPGAPAAPEAPAASPNYTIQQTVRLVVLDMVFTDARGNVVTDVKQNEVHVREADQAQEILNFEPAGAHMPASEASIESTADLDRLAPRAPVNIILLDEFNSRFEDMAFAQYSLKKFLEKQPARLSTPTMLIAVTLDKFTVLRDYTQSKDELLSALAHNLAVNPWQQAQGAWVGERYATAFVTLRRIAQATTGHRGHKNMVWIGRGFPARNWQNQPIDVENRIHSAVQNCVNTLRDARITLYTIDPAGVMADPNEYGGGRFADDPFGGNYEFNRLARATGGRTLYGRNDVNNEIDTAIRDGGSYYTISYRPSNAPGDPEKFRRILVTVDRPGLQVLTREGYYPRSTTPGKPFDPGNPSKSLVRDLIAADSSTMVYDGVPLTLTPAPADPDAYVIHIDAKGLVWSPATDTEKRHIDVIVLVSTFDKKGKELKRVARSIRATAPGMVPPTGRLDRACDITYKVDHDNKAVRARFVVRVVATNRTGTADANLLAQAMPPVKAP